MQRTARTPRTRGTLESRAMQFEDAPTQRIYNTSVGPVDFVRASEALNHIVSGGAAPDQFRVLSALCTVALRPPTAVITDRGVFDALSAAQLLNRMRDDLQVDDIDALWSLLFVLFSS